MWAALWPVCTVGPVLATLVLLNLKYPFIGVGSQLALYGAFLVGVVAGALLFYDLPIKGNKGFRAYLESRTSMSHQWRELVLAVIWTFLLAAPAFSLYMVLGAVWPGGAGSSWGLLATLFGQIGFVVVPTTLVVAAFVFAVSPGSRADAGRGIVAGLFLRVGTFFGLIAQAHFQ